MAWWLFQNVVMTTALAAIVALVCRTGRIGPVARHALWLLVLVKFITPPVVAWPWDAPDPLGLATVETRVSGSQRAGSEDLAPDTAAAGDDGTRDAVAPQGHIAEAALHAREPGEPFWAWLLAVWVAGSVCLVAIEGVRLTRLARLVRAAGPPDGAITRRVAALADQLGIRPVPVVMVPGGAAPIVWGAGRPTLLWPTGLTADSSDACIDGLLVHELAHVKRGDHLVGWLELAAGIVWWWNPLFWYVRSALREQAELACDAWVISTLPHGRRAYAESLLTLSGAAVRGASSSLAAVGIRATSRRVLERRLVMIMKGRSALRLPYVGVLCLSLVAAGTFPAWAASQQPPPPPPPASVPVVIPPQVPTPKVAPPAAAPARRALRVTPALVDARVPSRQILRAQKGFAPVSTLHFATLVPEANELVTAFETDREAIQAEADQKVEARRQVAIKTLEALQQRLATDGKLDEAIAIRNYLRAGGPGSNTGPWRIAVRK